ncbi:MAG: hypothetical protein ACRCUT_08755, partial [Spirochaetota bacterium]
FAGIKTGGACAAWYLFRQWQNAEKDYRAADKARNSLGLSADDDFAGADGRSRSANDYKRDYDRQAQYCTMVLLGNAAVYTVSWLLVWRFCERAGEKAIPAFDVEIALGGREDGSMFCGVRSRF